MASITSPRLNNTIRTDVPAINAILKALAKADPSILSDIENGTKRFYEGTSGWEFQELINGAWTTHTNFNIDAQSVDGFNTSVDAVASTIVVRGTDGKLKGNLTGKADTAGTADKLASTLAVTAGGTGATSVADARTNLGVPPTNHKSTTTNYGVSSATEYGHSMAGSATPKPDTENGTVGVDVTHFSRQDHAHPITKGTTSTVGAVTLKDTYTGNETASTSTGISPKGVQVAVDDLHTATIEAVEMVISASTGGDSGEITVEGLAEEIANLTNKFVETEQTVDDKISEFRTELDTSISSVNSTLSAKLSKSETKYITATWSSGTSWYRKYSDGWVEQGGRIVGGNSAQVTFHVPFKNTNYTIRTQWNGGKSSTFFPSDMTLSNITTTGFTCPGNSGTNVKQRDWEAKGYA